MKAAFDGFELDGETFELRHDGARVALEPQVFDVLVHLIRHRDRVVTKEELLDSVWGDRFVSESALTSRIRAVRRALGDDRHAQRYIRTAHGRGYRFVGAARVDETEAPVDVHAASDHNLPAERTPVFGRERDIAAVAERLAAHRLVSILGIGGTGKSRLAGAVGRHLLARFPAGVWFVDLAPVERGQSVDTALAHAAGLGLAPGSHREELAAAIDGRDALYVLDGCEHLRDEVVSLLDDLLERTARPRFLVTSREPLGLADEARYLLDPLPVGRDEPGPAVELFLASAERVGAAVDRVDPATVARICERLDGLPLALELAAAQLRVLDAPELLARLDQRFELLHAARASAHERQASLRTVLDDTWAMLDPDELDLLGRLAAFPGSFDVSDAERMARDRPSGWAGRTLGRLADRSLLVTEPGDRRHRLLETVRLFARQHTDHDHHATRHAEWCLGAVGTDVRDHVFDFETALWCNRHWDDLGAAERHLLRHGRGDDAAMLVAAPGLAMHLDAGARAADTLRRIDEHLARSADPAMRARLHVTGALCGMATRSPASIAHHGQAAVAAAEAAGDELLLSIALVLASWSTTFEDADAALAMVADASRRAEAVGDDQARDFAEGYRAFHLALQRRYDEALAVAEAVVARATGSARYGQATYVAVTSLAAILVLDDPARAATWVDDLLELPSPEHAMWASQVLVASIQASNGRADETAALVDQVRRRLEQAGQDWLPDLLVPAAVLAHRMGDDALASRWVRAVRDAGRPTQSFLTTCVYRRVREAVGLTPASPLEGASLAEIGDEALTWLHAQSSR